MDLKKEFKGFIERNQLNLYHQTIVLGVSGGIDSMVMLNLMEKIQDEYGFKIVVAHVNHKKRKESEIEEEYIKKYCENKHDFCVLHFEEEDKNQKSFQEYARNKRLSFFFDVMDKYDTKYLMLAHHLNDDIETFIMHLIRGASFESILGIKEVNNYHNHIILRPFLNVLKKDLYEYGKENDVKYFEDSSNLEDDYTRNRIRHKVVSALFEENPNFGENFLYFKDRLAYANELINQKRDEFINNNVVRNESEIKFDIDTFKLEDEILKYEILFEILRKYDLSKACIEEILKIIDSNKNNIISNISDIWVIKDKNCLIVREEEYQKEDFYLEINDLGIYDLNDEYEIEFSKLDDLEKKCALSISNVNNIWYNINMFPFYIRTRVDGDVMLLSKGHKKIKDILIDCKMSKMDKDKVLLLEDKNKDTIAILGVKKSALLSKATNLDLKIELRRKKMIKLHPCVEEIVVSHEDIVTKCEELGQRISKDYQGRCPILIGLLKGAVPFMAELIKHVTCDIQIDFMDVSSYNGVESTGVVRVLRDVSCDVKDRDIIFVEDIIDTGLTLHAVIQEFKTRKAKSIEIATLLDKPEGRKINDVNPKYIGYNIPKKFVVGFGLDYNELYRNLPYIGVLKREIYEK